MFTLRRTDPRVNHWPTCHIDEYSIVNRCVVVVAVRLWLTAIMLIMNNILTVGAVNIVGDTLLFLGGAEGIQSISFHSACHHLDSMPPGHHHAGAVSSSLSDSLLTITVH
jgi:hypothetical protein